MLQLIIINQYLKLFFFIILLHMYDKVEKNILNKITIYLLLLNIVNKLNIA